MDPIPFSATDAANTVYSHMNEIVVGRVGVPVLPDAQELQVLVNFVLPQYAYGQQIGVMDPTLYAYEALGAALATSTFFEGNWGNSGRFGPVIPNTPAGDTVFIQGGYQSVFGHQPTLAQIEHFQAQLQFLQGIYTASGAYGSADNVDLIARGAIYGQMIGIHNEMVPFVGVTPPQTHPGILV